MSKPILVGYDPATADRAPVNFGVAAARFTGAPLIVASAAAAVSDRHGAGDTTRISSSTPRRRSKRPGASWSPRGSRSSAAR